MDKNKIEIRDLYLIFGSERSKAFRMLKKGKSKNEILKETGCTIAVNNASLSVREGEIFVIMGLSGSGKSSLLRCINRLNRPTSGEILINGEDIAGMPVERLRSLRRKELAMVFQHFGLLPHYTVLQNIAFGLELQGVEKRERELKAAESMRLVGLDGYADLKVSELSGGMQQRVGLARALANDPEPADGRGLLRSGPADTGTDAGRAAGLAVKNEKKHRIYHTRPGGGCQAG